MCAVERPSGAKVRAEPSDQFGRTKLAAPRPAGYFAWYVPIVPADMSEDPAAYWNERAGAGWVRAQAFIDHMLAPIDDVLLSASAATLGERVIEIGSGGGSTAIALARRVGPDGHVLGVDVSTPLVEHARRQAEGLDQLSFQVGDAATCDLEPLSAHLLTSRFGVMFFPDPTGAFAHLHGCVRPDGRLVMATWQPMERNAWATWILEAFPEAEPMPFADDRPGPFSLSRPDRIRQVLEGGGFRNVQVDGRSLRISPGADAQQALAGMSDVGPLARVLGETEESERPGVLERARAFLAEQYAAGPPRLPAAIWLIHAEP